MSAMQGYTAKLTDGPLEGKTITTEFLESGEPRPSIEIPSGHKKYVYARSTSQEFEASDRPSAIDYRYLTTSFD